MLFSKAIPNVIKVINCTFFICITTKLPKYKIKSKRYVYTMYNVQDYSFLYNTAFHPVICEGWQFTDTCKAFAWQHYFTIRPTKLVFLRLVSLDCPYFIAPSVYSRCTFFHSPCHFLLKCLYQAEKVSGRVFVYKGCRFCFSTILIFDFVIVPPVWYFLFSILSTEMIAPRLLVYYNAIVWCANTCKGIK
jgi:hypothetical protein